MGEAGGEGANFLEQTLDVGLNFISGGLVGYDRNRGLQPGGLIHAADEGLGEITGRNLQREQMHRAEARVREEDARREELIQEERRQDELQDLQASQQTGAARRRIGPQAQRRNRTFLVDGGDEEDFLGI